MKNEHRQALVSLIILVMVGSAQAKIAIREGVYLDGEFRPRLEFDNLDFSNDTGFDAYASYRTRLGLGLDNLIENTMLYLMIGDSRMMGYANPYLTGKPPGPNGFDNNLGVVKAYLELRNLFGEGSYVRVGRMDNDQGRYRIFGPGDWNFNGPRTYDGIKVGYQRESWAVNAWSLYGANGDRHWVPISSDPATYPSPSVNYKRDNTLTGVDVSLIPQKIELMIFLDLDQNPVADTLHGGSHVASSRWTAATYVEHQWGPSKTIWLEFDAAYQFGAMGHPGGNGDISAYLLAGDLGWKFYPRLNLWAGPGFHILSGDNGLDADEINYFYDNYCSKHRVLGHMDYFKSITGIKSYGLRDLIFRAGISPLKKLSVNLDLHHFSVQKAFSSEVDGSPAHSLGMELDTTTKYTIRKNVQTQVGIDFFWPTEDWQGPDSDMSTFIYVVMQVLL